MATLNSIDGQITSGGETPPINVEFPATNYSISCLAAGSSITYFDLTLNREQTRGGVCGSFSVRTNKITSMNNAILRDLGLIFNIPKPDVMPKFIDPNTLLDKTFPAKTLKIYFGTPIKPYGVIVWVDEMGLTKNHGLFGTTAEIKATKIIVAENIRIEEIGFQSPTSTTQPITQSTTQPITQSTTKPQPTNQITNINPLQESLKNLVTKVFNDAKSSNLTAEQYYTINFK